MWLCRRIADLSRRRSRSAVLGDNQTTFGTAGWHKVVYSGRLRQSDRIRAFRLDRTKRLNSRCPGEGVFVPVELSTGTAKPASIFGPFLVPTPFRSGPGSGPGTRRGLLRPGRRSQARYPRCTGHGRGGGDSRVRPGVSTEISAVVVRLADVVPALCRHCSLFSMQRT